MKSQQVTYDFFYTNEFDSFTLPKNEEYTLHTWTVKAGDTINFEAKLDSAEYNPKNNAVYLYLYDGDRLVAESVDDGNGHDDNSMVSMIYRCQTRSGDVHYTLRAESRGVDLEVTEKHFQMAYTTYGPGHPWFNP